MYYSIRKAFVYIELKKKVDILEEKHSITIILIRKAKYSIRKALVYNDFDKKNLIFVKKNIHLQSFV